MRIQPVEPQDFDERLQGVLANILRLRGSVYNLHRALANSPKALQAFMVFSEYIRDTTDLDPRLRELAVLRVATLHEIAYEIAQHQEPARRAGLTEEQLLRIASWQAYPQLFNSQECAVLAYVEEDARGFQVSDATFATLKQHLSDSQIVDLSLVVGWYLLCGALLVPLEVELEANVVSNFPEDSVQ